MMMRVLLYLLSVTSNSVIFNKKTPILEYVEKSVPDNMLLTFLF